jgi:hypothetical protein
MARKRCEIRAPFCSRRQVGQAFMFKQKGCHSQINEGIDKSSRGYASKRARPPSRLPVGLGSRIVTDASRYSLQRACPPRLPIQGHRCPCLPKADTLYSDPGHLLRTQNQQSRDILSIRIHCPSCLVR